MDDDTLEAVRRPLARLLRLGASRGVHARQTAAAGVSISATAAVLLGTLVEHGPLRLSDLADRADTDPGATSRQVRVLESDGLVSREGASDDGRVQVVEATTAGRRLRSRMAAVQDQHLAEVLDGWSDTDRRRFADLLGRFVDDLRAAEYRPTEHRTNEHVATA